MPSLYALLNKTKTSGGAQTLRSWLLRPLRQVSACDTLAYSLSTYAEDVTYV
jgi:DNA mismatch repair ATPase MutS